MYRVTEPFLIRSVSPMVTIGGGQVLAVNPKRHRRYDTDVTRRLATAASGGPRTPCGWAGARPLARPAQACHQVCKP